MKISKAHKEFSNCLQLRYGIPKQDALNFPEKYLVLNWEAVINFWLYLDTLSYNQLKVVDERYWGLSQEERIISRNKAFNSTLTYELPTFVAGSSAFYTVSSDPYITKTAARCSTYELIGLQKLLEQGHQPVFFPMFLPKRYKNCKPIKTMNDISRPVINSDEEDQKKLKTALTMAIVENSSKNIAIEAIERAVNRALQELER
jgi:hypothetical protein